MLVPVKTVTGPGLPALILGERLTCPLCGILLCKCVGFGDGPPSHFRKPTTRATRGSGTQEFSKAEAPSRDHIKLESSGGVVEDVSNGIYPGQARIAANDNPGGGKVWRTPSKNPLMIDRTNLTLQNWRKKPYDRDRRDSGWEDPRRMLILLSNYINHFISYSSQKDIYQDLTGITPTTPGPRYSRCLLIWEVC